MDDVLQVLKKEHWYSKFPKWVKILLLIVSVVTMIYWLGLIVYKILCAIRVIGAFVFEKRNYWTFLCCILILLVGSLIMAQGVLGLDPIGKATEFIIEKWQYLKEVIVDKIA